MMMDASPIRREVQKNGEAPPRKTSGSSSRRRRHASPSDYVVEVLSPEAAVQMGVDVSMLLAGRSKEEELRRENVPPSPALLLVPGEELELASEIDSLLQEGGSSSSISISSDEGAIRERLSQSLQLGTKGASRKGAAAGGTGPNNRHRASGAGAAAQAPAGRGAEPLVAVRPQRHTSPAAEGGRGRGERTINAGPPTSPLGGRPARLTSPLQGSRGRRTPSPLSMPSAFPVVASDSRSPSPSQATVASPKPRVAAAGHGRSSPNSVAFRSARGSEPGPRGPSALVAQSLPHLGQKQASGATFENGVSSPSKTSGVAELQPPSSPVASASPVASSTTASSAAARPRWEQQWQQQRREKLLQQAQQRLRQSDRAASHSPSPRTTAVPPPLAATAMPGARPHAGVAAWAATASRPTWRAGGP
eukprot:TRINITY_DN19661_c0_g1_i3.p1 TRINITY_DN19661_c0_g1~~TRINITY_DN19661_c0_g1_i3.p1  ORF type:complete len:420 (+),score=82.73 TRINITY_DN19661_c0_g1_i3:520-1779(+)